jgi:hypothetical protein
LKNSLIILGIWYAVNKGKPDKEYENFIDKPVTKTKQEVCHWVTTILNHADILKWTEDDMKATAYISLFTGPIAEQYIDDKNTAQQNWKILRDKYGTCGTMAAFHSL